MAQNSSYPLLLVTIAFFCVLFMSGAVSSTTNGDPVNGVGKWDVEKAYLKELGQYAVACYNLASQHQLTFQKVITCDHLSKLDHKLTIAAADGGVTHTYEAVVSYKPWIQYKKLLSFKLA